MGLTHLATGIVISAALTSNPVGILVGAVAALLPDIDEPNSMISKRILVIPHIIGAFGHRKITHSLLGLLLFCVPIFIFLKEYLIIFTAGYLSHLILDSLTMMGVPWGYPIIQKHYSLSLGRSGGILEGVYVFILTLAVGLYYFF